MGHAIAGIEGVDDRHSYLEEKAHALGALESLLFNILRPWPGVRWGICAKSFPRARCWRKQFFPLFTGRRTSRQYRFGYAVICEAQVICFG